VKEENKEREGDHDIIVWWWYSDTCSAVYIIQEFKKISCLKRENKRKKVYTHNADMLLQLIKEMRAFFLSEEGLMLR
jgi:NAD-dependent SIR2 family protein deacetylase